MNPPHNPLGPVHRPSRDPVDSIIKPLQPVVRRTIDLNPWLLLLVIILSVPASLWCYEHWMKFAAPPPAAPVAPAPPPAPIAASTPPPAPPPPPMEKPAEPVAAPALATVVKLPLESSPAVTAPVVSPPPAAPAPPPSNQIPAGFHRIVYSVTSNFAGDSLRAKFTDAQGRVSFQAINASWRREVILKNGTTVVFGVSLNGTGSAATYVRIVIMQDGAVWKSEEAAGENAEPQVSGVISG